MSDIAVLAGVSGALLVGAISPGPSFLVTAQTSLVRSRKEGLLVALGIGAGGLLFAALALGGLIALLTAVEPLYVTAKIAGAVYLFWLAHKMWRGARSPLSQQDDRDRTGRMRPVFRHPFLRGLTVQLSNPKTAIVYASVFASVVPQSPHPLLYPAILGAVFAVECGWYSAVAAGMSVEALRNGYGRTKKWGDRLASVILAALGLRLLATATTRSL